MKAARIRKISIMVLLVMVSLLVVYSIYANRSRFFEDETIRYSKVTIDANTAIEDIIDKYSSDEDKGRFISEVKKINNLKILTNDTVYGMTILVPVVEN